MKKLLTALCLTTVTVFMLNAQGSKVTTTWTYLNYYEQEQKVEDLEKARENIDIAVAHEKSSLMGKAWFFRGKTYYLMALNEEISKNATEDLLDIAFESFQKVVELEDRRFRDLEQMWAITIDISRSIFNRGITEYENQEFAKAYQSFMKTIEVNTFLQENDKESLISSDDAEANAALAAKNAGMNKEEMAIYKKQMAEGKGDANMYSMMVKKYKEMGEIDESKKILKEGLEKYPSDINLIIDDLNYYIAEDKLTEAIDKLDKAIELDPDNSTLHTAKGNALERDGDILAAKKSYKKALEIDPENYNALNNLIAAYLADANKMKDEMDKLGVTPAENKRYEELEQERKDLFEVVLPYVNQGLELRPENQELQRAQVQIKNALGVRE